MTAFLLLARHDLYCQETEAGLKEQAGELFENEKYVEATSLYLRLLALNPRSHDYNFRYGTCLLYNSYKKQDAFKYLNYSVSDPNIDVQAYYFLGKAFHLNYQFNEAIKNYELYKQKAAGKPKTSFEVERQIEMCQNGKRLLTTITDIIVLEKKEFDRKEFFRLYNLDNIGGDLIVGAAYQSKVDKKKGHVPLMHVSNDAKALYYSSYGESDNNQKDIYMRRKLPDGNWSLPQLVQGNVNSKYDEDFPYMHPGGEYLYFASKGHNSMGGYDIFRSKLNPETGAFGPPENMDFAVSSPDDDIFYVVDSLDQNAYFASARQSNNGKLFVYKVRVDRVPLQLAVIKGSFSSTVNPDSKKLSIVVYDFASGEKIGTFATNERSSYLITLPKGGKYKYEMKVEGKPDVHTYVVNVPFFKEFHPLKQKIVEEKGESGDVVRVIDLFSEAVDDPVGILAEVIKNRSELNPNASQFDLKSLDADKENERILAELGFKDATPDAVAAQFDELARNKEKEVKASQALVNGSLDKAMVKLEEAAREQDKAKTLVNKANNAQTKQEKFELFEEAKKSADKAGSLKAEAKVLMAFSDSVSKKIPQDQILASKIAAVKEEVQTAVRDGNVGDLKDIIGKNTDVIANASVASDDPVEKLVAEKTTIEKEKAGVEKQRNDYSSSAKKLEEEIKRLGENLPLAKKKDQPGIQSTIDSKTAELGLVNEEKAYLDKKLGTLTEKQGVIDKKISFLQDVTKVDDKLPVPAAAVQTKLAEVDTKNSSTLAAYINQQVTVLKSDPEVKSTPSDEVAASIRNTYQQEAEAISKSADTPADKKRKQAELDDKILDQVDSQLQTVNDGLAKTPNDAELQSRKAALTKLRSETAASKQRYLDEQATASTETTSPAKELQQLDPGYEFAMDAVSGDEKSVLTEKNRLDETVLVKINNELAAVNGQLTANPADAQLADRKEALETLKEEKTAAVKQRQEQLKALAEPSDVVVTPQQEQEKIDPSYTASMEAVTGNDNSSLEKKNVLDKDLVNKIDQEIAAVNEGLTATPGDKTLAARKEALQTLKQEKQTAVAAREKELKSRNAGTPEVITAASELKKIDPGYEAAMNNVSVDERSGLEEKNALDRSLVDKIDQQVALLDEKLEEEPTNKTLVERKNALAVLRSEKTAEIAKREERLKEIEQQDPVVASTPESEKSRLAPGYETLMAAANSGDPESTLTAKNDIDKALIGRIDEELDEIEGQVLRNPDDKQAQERKTALEQLKTSTQELIAGREQDLEKIRSAATAAPSSLETAVKEVRPEYTANKEKIVARTAEGKEREIALLKEEEQLLSDLDKAVSKADEQAIKNPDNEGLQQKATQLKEAQAVQESAVREAQANLTAIEASAIDKASLQQAVAPGYKAPDLSAQPGSAEQQEAIRSEEQLREALTKREQANAKKLAKSYDPKLAAENKVLAGLKQDSEAREAAIRNPQQANEEAIAAVNNDLGDDAELLMRSKPETIEQAKRIITELKEYEMQLDQQLNALREETPEDVASIELKDQQLVAVRKRIGIVTADLDAMENYVVPVTAEVEKETELVQLNGREKQLLEKQAQPGLSKTEQKAVARELKQVQETKVETEKEVLSNKLVKAGVALNTSENELAASASNNELAAAVLKNVKESVESAPEVTKATPAELTKDLQRKQEAITLLTAANDYIQLEKEFREKGVVTENIPQLETRKKRFLVEIGQLEAMGAELEGVPGQEARLQEIRNEQALYENAVQQLNTMIAQSRTEAVAGAQDQPLTSEVTYEEEVDLQQKPAYQGLVRQQQGLSEQQRELNQVKREREALRSAISVEESPEKRAALVNALVEMERRIATSQKAVETQEAVLNDAIVQSGLPTEKVKNMLAREVPYKAPVAVLDVLAPELKTGFNIVANPTAIRKEKQLPVGLKMPDGLVYRVQVGAYAKALPENLFTEFTPVTGEKLTNGITRYLAGYFGNRQKALDAQRSIRGLGYTDAFVVAYCDGQRISVAEARRLEAAGLCVPKNQDSLMLQVVENTLAQLPADSVAKIRPVVKKSDYNKAPGAAPAEAAEDRLGLFFTVQVGVYNRPATMEQLRNIEPLITKRLPNGQIRYSSGIFPSIDAAKPKRVEAVTRGITDAFITAYYKGERISLADAKRLLEEQGDDILEKEQLTELKPELFEEARIYAAEQPVPAAALAAQPVQIVSKRTYDTYPAEELARLNSYGTFYYDNDDQRIKSMVYSSASALPILQNIPESMDTVFQKSETGSNFEPKQPKVVAEWSSSEIGGALADWLLRTGWSHTAGRTASGFVLYFEDVEPAEREGLIRQLQAFGAALVTMDDNHQEELITPGTAERE